METLDAQIFSLTDQAATTVLELALRRAGLTPDPFSADHSHNQLRACSGREGLNLTGVSPGVPIARFRHVAIPQLVLGNHTCFAWRTRPGCLEDLELLR